MILVSLLSATARKFLARMFFFVIFVVLYFVAGRIPGHGNELNRMGMGMAGEVTPVEVNATLVDGSVVPRV